MPIPPPLLLLAASAAAADFPERVPGMVEACLVQAAESGRVTRDGARIKYLCNGAPAERLWAFLEAAGIESWEQDTPDEGRWLSRAFPLGGCFRRVRTATGAPTDRGLSCSVWIPAPAAGLADPPAD